MSQDWYLLTVLPPVFNSGFEQEEFDNYATEGFNELLSSPLSDSVVLSNSDLSVNTTIKAIVQNTTSDSDVDSLDRQILAIIGTIQTGKYITYRNKVWLITGLVDNNKVYEKAIIKFCQNQLKWQNSSGTIITRYAVVEKPTNTSLNDGTVITTSDKQYSIKLPFDAETQNLHVDKRFLLEKANGTPLSYRLSSFDGISSNYGQGGILNIGLTQDEYNATGFPDGTVDNEDLMIANYFVPIPQPTGQAQISGSSTILSGGSYKYYVGIFTNEQGEVLPDIVPVWSFIPLPEHASKYTTESLVDGRFRVKVALDNTLIGSKFKIVLDDSNGLYHGEILVEVNSL